MSKFSDKYKRVLRHKNGRVFIFDKKKNKLVEELNPPLLGYLCSCGCCETGNYSDYDLYLYKGKPMFKKCILKSIEEGK